MRFYALISFCLALLLHSTVPAMAQEAVVDIIRADETPRLEKEYNAVSETHPPIRLTPDQSQIVRLDSPAGSVIIGNSAHLNILADSQNTLVLVPRAPGASHFTVLDRHSAIIMQRHVIVAGPQKEYIRIRQSCATADEGCQPVRMYYCPDMCHEIAINPEGEAPATPSAEDVEAAGGSASAPPEDPADMP